MIVRKNTPGVTTRVNPGSGNVVTKATLAPMVVTNTTPQRAGSSIGRIEGTGVQFQEYILDNSGGGAAVNYMIGDANSQAATNAGITVANPTSTTSGTVAGQKTLYATRPIQAGRIQMQATVSANQFRNPIKYVIATQDGGARIVPIRSAPFASAQDYNDLIRTLDVTNAPTPVVLNDQAGLVLTVSAGESVYVAIEVLQRIAS